MVHQIWLIDNFISHSSLILVINSGPLGHATDIISIVSIVRHHNIPMYFYITDKGCLI